MRAALTTRELASRISNMALAIGLGVTTLFIAWLIYSTSYIGRVVAGPEPMTLTELAGVDGEQIYGRWLDLTAEVPARHLLKTTTTRRRGGTSVTNHFVLIGSKGGLIVETSDGGLPPRFLAWASEFDQTGEYYQRARKQLDVWTSGRGSIALSPVLLQHSSTVETSRWTLAVGVGLATLLALGLLWRALRLKLDFTRVAPLAALRRSARAPEGMARLTAELDQQLALIDPTARRTGVFTLPDWLVDIRRHSFSLMSTSDVIWIVPYTVSNKTYGFTTSTGHQIHVIDRNRQKIVIQTAEQLTMETLGRLHQWAPWAVVGDDEDMEAQFGAQRKWRIRSKAKRARLIEAVDERREEIMRIWAAQAAQQQVAAAAGEPTTAPGQAAAAAPPPSGQPT